MTLNELSQLYYLNREIKLDQQRLQELEEKCSPGSPMLDGMPRSFGMRNNKVERLAVEIADLRAIIAAKQIQCIHERQRLERYISTIPDSLTRMVFTLRFISGLSWLQVALRIGGNNTEDSVKKTCYRYLDRKTASERPHPERGNEAKKADCPECPPQA